MKLAASVPSGTGSLGEQAAEGQLRERRRPRARHEPPAPHERREAHPDRGRRFALPVDRHQLERPHQAPAKKSRPGVAHHVAAPRHADRHVLPPARRLQQVDAPRRARRRPSTRPGEAVPAAPRDAQLTVMGPSVFMVSTRAVQIPLDVHLQLEVDEHVETGRSCWARRQRHAPAAVGGVEVELDPIGGRPTALPMAAAIARAWTPPAPRRNSSTHRGDSAVPSRASDHSPTRRILGDPARRDDGWWRGRRLDHPSLTRSAKVRM